MFSLFKRSADIKPELTFKVRVQLFWEWYAADADRFFQTIENKKCSSLVGEVSAKVDELLPGFAWVFGPGENGLGHSFTLTGEGILHRQLLAKFWHSQAPKLAGWTFYHSRQPGTIQGMKMDIGGKAFDPIEFWITAIPNRESEKLDLVAWHPLFGTLPERERWKILFLFLDEVLGEFGTQQWIGEIKINDQKLAEAMPLHELQSYLKNVEAETGWKKYLPGESWVGYRLKQQHQRFIRGDIFVGSINNPRLMEEYLKAEGELSDPLTETGAEYVFVAFESGFLPPGKESETRGVIEDAIARALQTDMNGRVLGGALGTQNAYIDLMLFDGVNSLETVRRALAGQNLPAGTSVNYFAKEKRGHRIVL